MTCLIDRCIMFIFFVVVFSFDGGVSERLPTGGADAAGARRKRRGD